MSGESDFHPDMTVVLVTATGLPTLWRTLASIAAQTIAHRLEVVILAPDTRVSDGAETLLECFGAWRIIAQGPIGNVDHAAAKGLLAARGPIVASIEDHAYPDPEWAEQLLTADDGACVAIGSAMINANPGNPLSWSNMLIAYGQWSEATPAGPIRWVALHNGAFRREALQPYGADLWRLFNRESEILTLLARDGGSFRFAPGARIRHLNPSSLGSTTRLRIDAGRLYAANRARDDRWGVAKRLAYIALGPAIPLLRYARMRKELFGKRAYVTEARHGPALLLGLVFDALGQMAGFAFGPGGARERLATFEMDRLDHLDAVDRRSFAPVAV